MQRKRYDAAFKAKAGLVAVKGLKTINEVAARYGVASEHGNEMER